VSDGIRARGPEVERPEVLTLAALFKASYVATPPPSNSKLRPDVVERVLGSLAEGQFRRTAAHVAGISEDSISEWMKRGAGTQDVPPEEPFATFRRCVLEIEAMSEARLVAEIASAADWKAKAWMLERRQNLHWGDPVRRMEVDVRGNAPAIEIVLLPPTPEDE